MAKKLIITALSTLTLIGSMTACTPIVVGGTVWAGGNTVATVSDRRSTGAVVNDEVLEKRIYFEIHNALDKKIGEGVKTHITVTAYNGRVLLSGEIESLEAKKIAKETALKSLDVAEVVDELLISETASLWQRTKDTKLATAVRARIIGAENVQLNQMKVVVERDIVYLMGILTKKENALACQIAAKTSGAKRVISIVEIMTQKQIDERMKNTEN